MVGFAVSAGRFAKPLCTKLAAGDLEALTIYLAQCLESQRYQVPLLVCMFPRAMVGRVEPGTGWPSVLPGTLHIPLGAADSRVYGVHFIAPKTLDLLAVHVSSVYEYPRM